jgi:hypothetical protein
MRTRTVFAVCLWVAALAAHSAFAQSWTHLSFPAGTAPVGRSMNGQPGAYDPASNRMIIFGGRDREGKNLNDVWVLVGANGIGAHQWVELIKNGAAGSPPARSGHSTVYDSVNNRLIVFGGCGGYCVPVLNDVWVLSNANGLGGTPVWTQLQVSGGPAARTNAAASYDSKNNRLIVFGGQDGSANPCSTFSDLWTLEPLDGLGTTLWARFQFFNAPGPAGQNGAAAASVAGGITLFGGMGMVNGTCTATDQISTLYPLGSQIFLSSPVPGGVTPPARSFASLALDAISGQMLLFGGMDASGNYLNDVWNYFGGWTQITPKDGPPPARSGQAAVLDSANQRLTTFGGGDASGVLNDTWVLDVPGISGMSCTAAQGVPNISRAEGLAELMGDIVLNCVGGWPTPPGKPIPEYTLTYTLDTNITSRRLPEATDLSEALLTIDEPYPAVPIPGPPVGITRASFSPSQILCTPIGSTCQEKGTGGAPSPYQSQPNVFLGKQTGVNTMEWKFPIDPPGANFTRIIRITNVRADAAKLGIASGLIPTEAQATVELQGTPRVPVAGSQPVAGVVVPGALTSLYTPASIPQCALHNAALLGGSGTAAFDFSVQITEGFSYAFKFRNYGTELFGPEFPPALSEQNLLGFWYRTETGFYSPSLFTSAPTLGLADFGTRIRVSLGSVQTGTHLFVPTTITLSGQYGEGTPVGQLQLIKADSNGKSAAGYEPIASTATIGTTPVAKAGVSGSTAYAIYEVIYSDPNVLETATIPVAVAFTNQPAIGEVMATTTLAPLDTVVTANETSHIPRFTNISTAQPAYSITSCPAP